MNRTKKILLSSVAGLALLGGSFGAAQYAAADEQPPTTQPDTTSGSATQNPDGEQAKPDGRGERNRRGDRHQKRREGFTRNAEKLAEKLGVSQDQLKEALKTAHDTVGKPERLGPDATSQQRMAAREEHKAKIVSELAGQLGIEETAVTKALSEIKEEADAKRAEDAKPRLDRAVQDGKLTDSEAAAVQKAIAQGIAQLSGEGRG